MSKSKRVFLTIMGDDDFWGNGDGIEDNKESSTAKKEENCAVAVDHWEDYTDHPIKCDDNKNDDYNIGDEDLMEVEEDGDEEHDGLDDEDEDEDEEEEEEEEDGGDLMLEKSIKYNFEEKNIDETQISSDLNSLKIRSNSESSDSGNEDSCSITSRIKNDIITSDDFKTDQKDSGAASIESTDVYHVGYRNFFQTRPEAEVRAFIEGPFDVLDEKFFDEYEQIRKQLEASPTSNVIQQLRRVTPSSEDQRNRSKHAVVVSNFREPDRRLGRYSKYYYHHNVGPEVYSRKVFVGGLPACFTEFEILAFFSRFGRLQVDWPSKHSTSKSDESMNGMSDFRAPTSHLASLSPPFGQINPFVTDFSSLNNTSSLNSNNTSSSSSNNCSPNQFENLSHLREKRQQHLGYVFLLFEKERSVRDLVAECIEEDEGLFMTLEDSTSQESVRVQIRPWLLADAEFLMDFNVPINTKLVAFIGGVPRPLKAVELAHFFEQKYGHVVCVGIDIDNKFKYPRGSGRVAFSNYEAYVQAITDRYIVLDHEDIHKRVEIKPYFFHNQSCEECSGRYHRQHAPYFCPSLECFQYYCEPCWHKMHTHPSRFHHMPVIKGV